MSAAREKLQDALLRYTVETLLYIKIVKYFCENISEWVEDRTTAVSKMKELDSSFNKIDLSISHIIKSEKRGEALKDYLKNKIKQVTKESVEEQRAKLEEELAAVLNETLRDLEKFDCLLEAVEMLAVTSLHVFMEGNPVINLPEEVRLEHIRGVIIAARKICPLLLEFKRDAREFFSPECPRLENLEVMACQLDRYIEITKWICENLQKSHLSLRASTNIQVQLDEDLTDNEIQRMLHHIEQLIAIRMDPDFRLVFLFQEVSCSDFIEKFTKLQPRMLQFLDDLEKTAVQLDSMAKGAKISSVAGSSVGAIGGVLSIVGLALIPVTAGVSVPLIIAGAVCGGTSGVNSIVTTGTQIGINRKQQKKAKEISLELSRDMQSLYAVLHEVTTQTIKIEETQAEMFLSAAKSAVTAGVVGKTIDSIVDAASAANLLRTEDLVTSTGTVIAQEGSALRNVPRAAGDIPDIGQAALKGPLALSKLSRGLLIGVNSLFLGLDLFFVINDSRSLYKGIETKMSQFIRARAALLRSEIDAWEKIQKSLSTGLLTSENKKAVLNSHFYYQRGHVFVGVCLLVYLFVCLFVCLFVF